MHPLGRYTTHGSKGRESGRVHYQIEGWLDGASVFIKASRGETLLIALWLVEIFCRLPLLRRPYRALVVYLIQRTSLFDAAYYLETHQDVKGPDHVLGKPMERDLLLSILQGTALVSSTPG